MKSKTINSNILKIMTIAAYFVMIITNFLAVYLPIGGRSTGQISDQYTNLFTPAGYAFSIWSIIYLLLGIYVFYQLKISKSNYIPAINKVFIINALLNSSWIFAWHYNLIWLSLIIMICLLITLIIIANNLRINIPGAKEKWIVRLPFSIYFGWISVATIANVTVFLKSINWNGFGLSDSFWTVAVLLAGLLIGSWRMLHDRFIPYGLVFIWAYSAILVKHISPAGFAKSYPIIIWTVIFCLIIFSSLVAFISMNKKNS